MTSAVRPSGPVAVRAGASAVSTTQVSGSRARSAATSCGAGYRTSGSWAHDHGAVDPWSTTSNAAARAQRVRCRAQYDRPVEIEGSVEVVGADEIECAVGERPAQVVLLRRDPVGQTVREGDTAEPFDRHGGDIDGGDTPSQPGKPQRITAAAAPQVQHITGRQADDPLSEAYVGPRIGGRRSGRVHAIPELDHVGGAHQDPFCRERTHISLATHP